MVGSSGLKLCVWGLGFRIWGSQLSVLGSGV